MLAQDKLKLGLSLALIAAAVWLLHGFIPALLWAAVIAVATWPLRQRIAERAKLGDAGIATLMTALLAAVLFFPIAYALLHAAAEAGSISHGIVEAQKTGVAVPGWLEQLPGGASAAAWWRENLADPAALSSLIGQADTSTLAEYAREFGAQVAHRTITLLFTLLTLYFLYRDGRELSQKALVLLERVAGGDGKRYGMQAAVAIRATVNGLVLVGLGEGLLIGIAYVAAGAPHPAILGLVTGVLAMIPFAAPLIFIVVCGMLAVQGSVTAAIAVFVFGMVVLFVGDHFVRPKIIGDAVKLPFLWVLFGILGGVEVFGLIGLFVGPALMALVMTMWRDMTEA